MTIHHHHHHISVMELGHLLTRAGLTYPEVFSKICHDSFCQLGNSVSLPWIIYYETFYLHVVSSFSRIPVICLKLKLLSKLTLCGNNSTFVSSHQAFRINTVAPALQKLLHTHARTHIHTHTKWVSILPQAGSIRRATIDRCRSFCFSYRAFTRICLSTASHLT